MTVMKRWVLVAALVSCAPSRVQSANASASSGGTTACVLSGRWRMRSSGACAESRWTFEPPSTDGSVRATEEGCGGVQATGRWRAGRFELEGVTTDSATSMVSYAWTFDAACSSATGVIMVGSEQRDPVRATLEPVL